jgi:hypothetical protein
MLSEQKPENPAHTALSHFGKSNFNLFAVSAGNDYLCRMGNEQNNAGFRRLQAPAVSPGNRGGYGIGF